MWELIKLISNKGAELIKLISLIKGQRTESVVNGYRERVGAGQEK